MNNTPLILADAADAFDNPLVETFVQPVFYLIGGAILIMTVWRAVQGFAKGDFGKVARTTAGGFVAVLLCFNLSLAAQLAGAGTDLMSTVVDTISETLSGSGGGSGNPAPLPGAPTGNGANIPPAPAPGS
jgi:hypothetical protein